MIKPEALGDWPVAPSLRRLEPEDISPIPHSLNDITPTETFSSPLSSAKQAATDLLPVDLVSESLPELRRLSLETNETVLLAIFPGSNLTIITRQEPGNGRRMDPDDIGAAAHATAVGKAMLAWLPEPQIARVVADQGLTPFTRKTIDSLATLVENLRLICRHGFAFEDEEFMLGQSGIACAIRGESGEVLGAVGCIIPTASASHARLKQFQGTLMESVALLSHRPATRWGVTLEALKFPVN